MPSPRITVRVGTRDVPLEQLADARLASALRTAGDDVGRRLETIRCAVHGKTATNVRVHFDAGGNANLQYDSCCEALGKLIGETLG